MKKNTINILNDLFDENFSFFQIKNDIFTLRTNIKEFESHYQFEVDVAGINKNDIDINIEDEYLIIVVNNKTKEENTEYTYLRKEIVYKNSRRKYYIGNIIENQIKATINNGILQIVVPKENEQHNTNKIIID